MRQLQQVVRLRALMGSRLQTLAPICRARSSATTGATGLTHSRNSTATRELFMRGAASGVHFEIIFEGEGLPEEPQP